jgi:predicted LPLAT superfamily acyltransferase
MARKADDVTWPRPEAPAGARAAEWVTHRERGSVTLMRLMTFLSLRMGRPVGRFFLYFIAAYFFAFAPTARRHARAYLRRVFGREPTAGDRFQHVLSFATTIHDRVYLMKDRLDLFDISIRNEELVKDAVAAGQGAFLMGAHVGSFDILRAVGQSQPGLRVAMAMYEKNARRLNSMLAAINPAAKPAIIALGQMDAMLKIQEHLDRGAFVGVLGDRTLGDEPTQVVEFLGGPARFPVGAMRAAAIMRRAVIFMIGLYCGGNRYEIVFEPLADFSEVEPRRREAAVRSAIERYAALLEQYVRAEPYNWFNFFDFWRGAEKRE